MKVLITGGAGMIGRKLALDLARNPKIGDRDVTHLTLLDMQEPAGIVNAPFSVTTVAEDIAWPRWADPHVKDADCIIHLAAIVSGEAEERFDKGYRVNFEATRSLLQSIRDVGQNPQLLFASSVAVYGGPYPKTLTDNFAPQPLSSYGTQKVMLELLIADHIRKGFMTGMSLRLPTICVRPGAPNAAASGFFSSIMREPLSGQSAVLPVPDNTRVYVASPRAAVGYFRHAMTLPQKALEDRPALMMPGLSVSVGEMIKALKRVAGEETAALIKRLDAPDTAILDLVGSWPSRFQTARANALGFVSDETFDAVLQVHIEDELGGKIVPPPVQVEAEGDEPKDA